MISPAGHGRHCVDFVASGVGPYVPAVQGVHFGISGRSLYVPAEQLQSTPYKVLLLAEHDPVKGATVHGLEAQVVGLTYLSAPCVPLFPSYP